jgi:Trk K+ transport system NAD-binding subunit
MASWRRRTALYLAGIALVMAVYTVAYNVGMATLEGRPQSILRSVQMVVETFTTTGYGADAPWSHPAMYAVVVAMQLTGVSLIFLTLPVFVFPLFEEMLTASVPTSADLSEHVVVCGFSDRDEHLVEKLEARDTPYVVVVGDEDRARDLQSEGHAVVHGDPERTATLAAASVDRARAVVIDAGDESNATIALSVREVAPDVHTVSYVEDPDHREYLEYAGADRVISPRTVLGESIANKVQGAVSSDLDTIEIGADFEIVELPVQQGSALDGVRLVDSPIRARTGVNVIGAWVDGEFVANPAPDYRIDRTTVLLAAGNAAGLTALSDLTRSEERRPGRDRVVIAGYGEVGSTVRDALERSGTATTVVDRQDDRGVDVVGDATEAETLREAGIEDADAVIIALSDDTTTIFATLVARELVEGIEIVSRADAVGSVPKLYAAGADYVLALATVSGRMLSSAVLAEDVVSLETNIEIVRTEAPALAGETLASADVRARTGVTVVAVERDGEVITDLPAAFELARGDALVVAGTDADVREFADVAGTDRDR